MPNFTARLIWGVTAIASAFAAEYFDIIYLFIITAFAVYRYILIDMIEAAVYGCQAAIQAEMFEQAEIMMADERELATQPTILDSRTFADRMNRFGDDA